MRSPPSTSRPAPSDDPKVAATESFAKADLPEPESAWAPVRAVLAIWGKRVALGGLALGLVLYLALVSVLAYRASLWGKSELGWSDFALAPFRWSEFREKQGRLLIARGMERFEKGRLSEALVDLRVGLSRVPTEVAPRVTLAAIYSTSDVTLAARELELGLEASPANPDLIEALLVLWRNYGAEQTVLDHASRDKIDAAGGRLRAVLVAQRTITLLRQGRAEEAREAIALLPEALRDAPPAIDLAVRVAIAVRDFATASRLLATSGEDFPASKRALLECEVAVGRGDDEELARLLRRLPTQLDSKVEPYLCAFMAWHQRGRVTLRERVQSELLDFHGADAEAMKRFSSLLVSLRDESALRALTGWLQERGADAIVQQAQLTQLALHTGRFPAAFRLLERWEPTLARYAGAERSDAEFVRRLTRAACDPSEAQATLLGSYLAGLPSPLAYSRYLLTLEVLPRAGVITSAAQIAEQAQRRFPLSDQINALSADIIRVARAHLDEEAKRRALTLEETQRRFADRAASLAAIRQALASGEALTARASLRELRAVRPAWLSAVERDLAFLEAIAAVLIEEPVDSRNVVRRALQVYPDEGMSLDLLRWSGDLERARPVLARMLREEVAQFGHRSPAVTERLATTDWEDAAWKNVRSADAARQAIDDALARRDPDYALRLVNLIRRSAPAWMEGEAVGLAGRELRARLQLHQKPAAASQLRELVRRGGASRTAVRGLIRDLANSGAYDDALFLATQWAESFPEDEDAALTVSNLRLKVPL